MTISNRIRGGFGALAVLTVLCGVAGFYGVSNLASTLRFITGPAWDTADGAMEGMIGIEAEMMGIYRLVTQSGSVDKAKELISEGQKMHREALGRMRNSGLMTDQETTHFDSQMTEYTTSASNLLDSYSRFASDRATFESNFSAFEKLMVDLEEVGDGAVEDLERNPNRAMSWNGGLRIKWTAADGAMESQIGLLRQLYFYKRMIIGDNPTEVMTGIRESGKFLDKSMGEIIPHPLFKRTRIKSGKFAGQSASSALTTAYQNHKSSLVNVIKSYTSYAEQKSRFDSIADSFLSLVEKTEEVGDGKVEGAVNASEATISSSYVFVMIAVVLSLGVAVFGGVWLIATITKPLLNAREAMRDIAEGEGDLTRRLDYTGSDELGEMADAFNRFASRVESVVDQVKAATEVIYTGAEEMAAGNVNLSQRTEEQASSLEETASSMEEMTGTVKQNADHAMHAKGLADEVRSQAEQGGNVMDQAVTAMSSINESSMKIVDIISAIDGIAFQTNLLALNAAVEAARAGDQGRGFAVVASEVRALAQRSAESAKEIKALIEESAVRVKAGTDLVDESGKTLMGIVDSVRKVNEIISEIAAASYEQSAGIDQVNQTVTQMDDMTQQNAALVEESAAASRSMQDQAQHLSELVSFFKTSGMASSSYSRKTPAPTTQGSSADKGASANQPLTDDSAGWQVFK